MNVVLYIQFTDSEREKSSVCAADQPGETVSHNISSRRYQCEDQHITSHDSHFIYYSYSKLMQAHKTGLE